MPYTTPYQKPITITSGTSTSAAIVYGNPDVGILPSNIRTPSNLQGTATIKIQYGFTNAGVTTWFDPTDAAGNQVSMTLVVSSVIPIYAVIQKCALGFDQMRLVVNTNAGADLALVVDFADAQDDNPSVYGAGTISGTVTTTPTTVTTDTVTQVASSASNVTLKAANAARNGLMIYNDSTQILFVKLSATASTVSYSVQIPPQGFFELPTGRAMYTGIVDGIWVSANGNAYVTEW